MISHIIFKVRRWFVATSKVVEWGLMRNGWYRWLRKRGVRNDRFSGVLVMTGAMGRLEVCEEGSKIGEMRTIVCCESSTV